MEYVVHTLFGSGGSFYALGPVNSIQLISEGPESPSQVSVSSGWLYLTGNAPAATSSSVRIQAQGTKIVIQLFEDVGRQPYPLKTVRVILLEGATVEVSKLDGSDMHELTAPQTYLDVTVRNNGVITQWVGPATFDPQNTPGSEGLMAEVASACGQHNVPPP